MCWAAARWRLLHGVRLSAAGRFSVQYWRWPQFDSAHAAQLSALNVDARCWATARQFWWCWGAGRFWATRCPAGRHLAWHWQWPAWLLTASSPASAAPRLTLHSNTYPLHKCAHDVNARAPKQHLAVGAVSADIAEGRYIHALLVEGINQHIRLCVALGMRWHAEQHVNMT